MIFLLDVTLVTRPLRAAWVPRSPQDALLALGQCLSLLVAGYRSAPLEAWLGLG